MVTPSRRTIRLLRQDFAWRPAFDTALARALLIRVSARELPESLWLHRPGSLVAFGRQDVTTPGYPAAVRATRAAGYEAVERLGGGRAAVFHDGTISFSWTIPQDQPREGIRARYDDLAAIMAGAFRRLGGDARVGEVPGEYCPGDWSVNLDGTSKVMGVGQRVAAGAAHVGGVVVVTGSQRINDVLDPVYRALEIPWDPAATGALAERLPGVTWDQVVAAIEAEFAARHDLVPGTIDDATVALASQLEPEHLSPGGIP